MKTKILAALLLIGLKSEAMMSINTPSLNINVTFNELIDEVNYLSRATDEKREEVKKIESEISEAKSQEFNTWNQKINSLWSLDTDLLFSADLLLCKESVLQNSNQLTQNEKKEARHGGVLCALLSVLGRQRGRLLGLGVQPA